MVIPRLTGLFEPPPEYKAPDSATENNLATISALADPSGTLERLQAEQVARRVAEVKLDGVDNLYRQHALKSLNDYQQFSANQYKQNTGLNRLNLTGEQTLAQDQKYKELLTGINALKDLSGDYKNTLTQAHRDVAAGIITPESYKAFEDELTAKMNSATGIGDLPMAHAVYNNFLAKMPYDWATMAKELKAGVDGLKPQKSVDKQGNERYNVEKADPTQVVDNMFDYNQKFRKFWLDQVDGDPIAARAKANEFAQKYAIDNRTWGGTIKTGGNTYVTNDAGGKNKRKPLKTVKNGVVYHEFGGKPVKDSYGDFSGEYTTIRENPDGTSEVFLKQVVNAKGEPIDVNNNVSFTILKKAGAVKDPNKSGGVWLPYNDKVEWSMQANDFDMSDVKANKGDYVAPGDDIDNSNTKPMTVGGMTINVDHSVPYTVSQIKKMFPAVGQYSDNDIREVFTNRGLKVK